MNQMRELFEKWATDNGLSIKPRDDASSPDAYFAYETEQRWIVWQAAQSVSVPVVGDVAGYVHERKSNGDLDISFVPHIRHADLFNSTPLIVQPATSITAAELERLQRNDARYLWMRNHTSFNYSVHKAAEVGGIELDQVIDAAIAGEKK